jgi:hypothetical protein
MNSSLKKNLLTHGLIVLGFLLVTIVVHYPTFLSGKKIDQHDILQSYGGNQQLKDFRAETGEEALWNPNMFGGMPAYLTGVYFSGDLLAYVYKAMSLGMEHPPTILFISMVSFYILLLSFKVRPLIAAAGAIAFGLNGFNIISIMAGHNSKIAAVALMPLVLAGIHLTFSSKRWLGFGLTALALGLQIRTNHPQITYYLALIVAAYGINQLVLHIKAKQLPSFGVTSALLVLAAILAVGANFGRLATTLEYSKYTIRGKSELSIDNKKSSGLDKEYAFRYSNGIMEPLFLFVPNIFGGSSQQELSTKSAVADALKQAGYNRNQIAQTVKSMPTYWGDQPLTAPYYAGTLVVVLFILGIVFLPKSQKVWLISLVILAIVLSWGKNFEAINNILFDYLPGYNKFRSVTFTIIIAIFSMNLLGFLALDKLLDIEWSPVFKKNAFISFSVSGGFLVLLLILSGMLGYRGTIDSQLPDWLVGAIKEDRQSLLVKDTLRALMFVAIFVGMIWAVMKQKIKSSYILFGLVLLIFIDEFTLSNRFLGKEKFVNSPVEEFFKPTEANKVLMASTAAGDRVLNLQNPFNENRTSYFNESIGGYHGAKIRRYQDLIDYCIQSETQRAVQTLQSQSLNFADLQVLNMLNTKFMYAGADRNAVFSNNFANGNAWIVSDVVPVNSADEEIALVCSIDTKTQALVDITKFELPQANGDGVIVLKEKTPNKLSYSANVNGGNALAVFSEIYYPKGWIANIDGEETNILRANYILRALEIPQGNHEIVFEFKPKSYFIGNTIMLISSILVLIAFVFGLVIEIKSIRKEA